MPFVCVSPRLSGDKRHQSGYSEDTAKPYIQMITVKVEFRERQCIVRSKRAVLKEFKIESFKGIVKYKSKWK